MNKDKLTQEQLEYIRILSENPMNYCCPCFFGDPTDEEVKVNNGTMTLIQYKGRKYGITNFHVIDAYRNRLENEPSIMLSAGNAELNLDNDLIDEEEVLDICIFDLDRFHEDDFKSNGNVQTIFFEVDDFTIGELKVGDYALFGGYPGQWRERIKINHLGFETLSSGASEVIELSTEIIRCSLSIEECIIDAPIRDELPRDLGGLSGGPVFNKIISPSGIESFKLVGIIFQYAEIFDSIVIRPITCIDSALRINRQQT